MNAKRPRPCTAEGVCEMQANRKTYLDNQFQPPPMFGAVWPPVPPELSFCPEGVWRSAAEVVVDRRRHSACW
jgi:hypothetical protein